MKHLLFNVCWLMALGAVVTFSSCDEGDGDSENPCTFEADSACFCLANPTDAQCQTDCTFEANEECFCAANPSDERCTTAVDPSIMDDAILGHDFEGVTIDDVFQNGTTGGTFANGEAYDAWSTNASISATIATDGGYEKDSYISIDVEVLTEGWAWVSNLNFQPGTGDSPVATDLSSATDPQLIFAVRSADVATFQFETAFNDAAGQSGTNTAMGLPVSSDWTLYALPLNSIAWNWGEGPDWSDIGRVQLGLNMNGQAVGSIFTLDIDAFGVVPAASLPAEAVTIDQSYLRNALIAVDFEGAGIDDVFQNGSTGGTFANGETYDAWTTNADVAATIESGNANTGDDYLSIEFEVLTEGWAWVSNINWQPGTGDAPVATDITTLDAPHLVFAARSEDVETFQFEAAFNDAAGQSGTNTDMTLAISSEWTVFALPLNDIVWNWGEGPDWSDVNRIQLGLNMNGQAAGEIFVVDIDGLGVVAGSDIGNATIITQTPPDTEQ